MDYLTATKSIIKFFALAWGDTTEVAYPDTEFTIPETAWLRFNIQHYRGAQASMGSPGSNRFRRDGLVTVQVFTPEGKGNLAALALADQVVNIFQGVTNNGIRYFDVQAQEKGPDGAGWNQINVLAYFQYDRIA